jgi:hypothetical protein
MFDYRKSSVYHLLDQLTIELYAATRELPPSERSLLGYPILQAATGATAAVIHGCLTRNALTRLPYIERAHGLVEELGQHLRLGQKLKLLPDAGHLLQRQQSCSRLLLQWRQTLVLNEEQGTLQGDPDVWAVDEEPQPSGKSMKSKGKKYPTT